MPGQFFSPEGDLEEHFITNHWLIDQYIGDQLWSWGEQFYGELGINDRITRSTPVREFTSSTNWKQVSAKGDHVAAIKTDGTLWSWGYNFYGQLGINSSISRSTPVQEFTSSTNWKYVFVGQFCTAAIKTDGTLWSWGYNPSGGLGVNDTTTRLTPVQEFTSSTNWNQVAFSNSFDRSTAAIKTDGTIWVWGDNFSNNLGINDTIQRLTAVQEFTSSTNWKKVVENGDTFFALKSNGQIWRFYTTPRLLTTEGGNMWKDIFGVNSNQGVLALNSNRELFTYNSNVGSLNAGWTQEPSYSTNWKYGIATSSNTGFQVLGGIKTDGTLWMWGNNSYGQLGINSNISRSTPVQEFTSSTNWKYITKGSFANASSIIAIKTGIELDTGNLTS
jgi:alpha-tubulin suppressor-like RCC1 family protein